MDQSISGGSRSRKDDTMSQFAGASKKSSKNKKMAKNGGFATERAWIDARLAYRRLVYRMIKEIESHCDDVICLSQNFLEITPEHFDELCNQEQVELIVRETDEELQQKQLSLHRQIAIEANKNSDSEGSESESESDDDLSEDDDSSGKRRDKTSIMF